MICGAMAGRTRPVFAVPPRIRAVQNGGARSFRLVPVGPRGLTSGRLRPTRAVRRPLGSATGWQWLPLPNSLPIPWSPPPTTTRPVARTRLCCRQSYGFRACRYPEQRAGPPSRRCRTMRADADDVSLHGQPAAGAAEHRCSAQHSAAAATSHPDHHGDRLDRKSVV